MATPTEIVRRLEADRFAALLGACPKAFREQLFRKSGIRAKGNTFALSSSSKTEVRAGKLLDAIKGGLDLGDDVLEEVIRNYLYTRRGLLADALDHFNVPHEGGLTDADLDFIEELPPEKSRELKTLLVQKHDPADVELYFAFMNIRS